MKRLVIILLFVTFTSFSTYAKGCYAVAGQVIFNIPNMSCSEYIGLLNKSECGCGSQITSCYDYFVTIESESPTEAYAVIDGIKIRIASDDQQQIADRITRLLRSGKAKKGEIEKLFDEMEKKVGGKISPERIMKMMTNKNSRKSKKAVKTMEMKKEE